MTTKEASSDIWTERDRWAASRLSTGDIEFLENLPGRLGVRIEGLGSVLFCHGSPRSDEEILTRLTPDDRLEEILADVEDDVVVCGHTHVQFDRTWRGSRIVNAGSVGLPYEGEPAAYWALLGPGVELRRTSYDLEEAVERMRGTGFPAIEDHLRLLLEPPSADDASAFFERQAGRA